MAVSSSSNSFFEYIFRTARSRRARGSYCQLFAFSLLASLSVLSPSP